MLYFVLLTNACNLKCKYCFEKAFEDSDIEFPEEIDEMNNEIKFSPNDIKKFIKNDKKPYLIFYGGEPTLRIDFMRKIIDKLKDTNARYIIQTNGILLDKIGKKYLTRFESIFVSLDGSKEITDKNRENGTYDKIIQNISKIRKEGYKKEITGRMVILEQNIYKEVLHLLKTKKFNAIHWQIDANFWFNDYKTRNFQNWLTNNYKPNLKKLVNYWCNQMKKGKILKLYPFIGIMQNILNKTPTKLMCGAGYGNIAIQTNGKIIPCPIMAGMKNYYLGYIKRPKNKIKEFVFIPNRCKKCNYLDLCGTRCLYSNIVNPWPEKEVKLVCESTKYLINLLKAKEKGIKKLIDQHIIYIKDFNYLKYNGAEIIP